MSGPGDSGKRPPRSPVALDSYEAAKAAPPIGELTVADLKQLASLVTQGVCRLQRSVEHLTKNDPGSAAFFEAEVTRLQALHDRCELAWLLKISRES